MRIWVRGRAPVAGTAAPEILKIAGPLCPETRQLPGDAMVESRMGAVAWGLRAITPFPIPAHRTVGPDFRSTALRLASRKAHGVTRHGRRSGRSRPSSS